MEDFQTCRKEKIYRALQLVFTDAFEGKRYASGYVREGDMTAVGLTCGISKKKKRINRNKCGRELYETKNEVHFVKDSTHQGTDYGA